MTTQTISHGQGRWIERLLDPEVRNLLVLLVFVCLMFSVTANGFLSETTFVSVAFQLPELGLLTLAMLMPIISGGFNLAITFTANLSGLAMAAILHSFGGADAGV
jgi:simple sugar transport system permease protein